MPRNVFALLVGINTYEAPVRSLHGCVNDINRIHTLLEARVTASGGRFHPKTLTDRDATRLAIIDGFRQHLGQANDNDVALFYYSGHGSQQNSPPEFWHLEPDHLDETLVCYDSRQPGSWDLADKELAQLLAEVAGKKAHVVVILDSCHSGSGTRAEDETGVRRVPTDPRERPLSTFLDGAQEQATRSTRSECQAGWVDLPRGRHILLAACRSDEEAKECSLGGQLHGVFSYFLGETLTQSQGDISYRDLFTRVNALVRSHTALQSPQIEPTDHAMFRENFLGGGIGVPPGYFTLSYNRLSGWAVDAGVVHGIPRPAGNETAVFAIFPRASTAAQWRDMSAALGTAAVRGVEPHRSVVQVSFTNDVPDENEVYKAVLATVPLAALDVQLAGDSVGLTLVRAALAEAAPTGGPSLLVRESLRENAEMRLLAVAEGAGSYRFFRPSDGRELVADVKTFSPNSAKKAVERLEHIARWTRVAEFRNPSSSLVGKVVVEVFTVSNEDDQDENLVEGTSLRLFYSRNQAGQWQQPKIKVRLTNHSKRPLYCALIGLTQTYGIENLVWAGRVLLEPEQNTWANDRKPIYTEVPETLWQDGLIEVRDVLKLIASTEDIDATLLEQDDLDLPQFRTSSKAALAITSKSTLSRLMQRVQMRSISLTPTHDEAIGDWTTQEFTFATVRPRDGAEISGRADVSIYPGVTVLSHPGLKAHVRLTTAAVASRDVVGGCVLPPLLRDNPAVSELFLFSSSRGGAPGLSVLELYDVADQQNVTKDQPLRLQINQALGADEHLLPLTYDGEFYIPIGRGTGKNGGVEVVIDALPVPQNTRSLFSALRIYFQKVISRNFGTHYRYPFLAVFDPDASEQKQVIDDHASVKAKVASAGRILLYVHGIIGETRGMAASSVGLAGPPPIPGLRERYDLILTFDYENLNTTIADSAKLLKQRLADAGLGPEHKKTLHIVAHSMGGLVSRWFIENEGGNNVVQHLVMLGTPNGGSPWPTVEEMAVTALSFGLNNLGSVAWPVKTLGHLVGSMVKVDVALREMQPTSKFLTDLNASADPGIPYSIIAGNTSIPASPEKEHARHRLLDRLKSLNLLHLATAPFFFGEANDIAVSVANMQLQPAGRARPATVREVPCDHLTYFSTEAGLAALAELLPTPPFGTDGKASKTPASRSGSVCR